MAFPLFRLPIIVIQLVLETMGFVDMFFLARTSAKTKRIFTNLVRIRNYQAFISLENTCFGFNFELESDPSLGSSFLLEPTRNAPNRAYSLKLGYQRVPYQISDDDGLDVLTIYSDTYMHTGTLFYNALQEVFRMPLQEVTIDLEDVPIPMFRCWISWNTELWSDALSLLIVGKCSFSNYTYILENVRTNHKLNFEVEPTQLPNDPGNVKIPDFGAGALGIYHGRWVNIQLLKLINAREITIWRISLTDSQINTLLRDWRASRVSSNWKQLTILFDREADLEIVWEGMDATDEDDMMPENCIHQWSFDLKNDGKCTVTYAEYENDAAPDVPQFGFDFCVSN